VTAPVVDPASVRLDNEVTMFDFAREARAEQSAISALSRSPRQQQPAPSREAIVDTAGAGLGAGAGLDATTRAYFEPRFGVDLSLIRVHSGDEAGHAAQALRADAFTVGSHIAFAAGRYAPTSGAGRHLLAHELAHSIEQGRSGRVTVDRRPSGGATPSAAAAKKPNNQLIAERPDLLVAPGESPTFDRLLRAGIAMGVRVAADPKPGAGNQAAYEPVNNAIWIPEAEFEKRTHDADVKRSITHELAHAVQKRFVVESSTDPAARQAAVEAAALAMTEDEYVAVRWKAEVDAETTAWVVSNESVDHFDRKRGGSGFSRKDLDEITTIRVEEFSDQTRKAYEAKFRADFRAIAAKRRAPARTTPP
jgi:Domain of unknown function (DUF4157)